MTLVFSCGTSFSQRQLVKGERAFEELSFAKAIRHFEKAVEKGSPDSRVLARLGDSYMEVNRPSVASRYYKQLMAYSHEPIYDLRYGQALMAKGAHREALTYLERYRKSNPQEARVNNLIHACEQRIALSLDDGRFMLVPTNINSSASDFGPVLHEGALYFSSSRKKSKFKFNWDESDYLDLFSATYSGSPRLGTPETLEKNINTRFHEATPCIFDGGRRMLFTRNNFHKGVVGFSDGRKINLKLYEAEWDGKKWKVQGEFPYNNEEYSTGHPSVTKGADTLFFASDMPGGEGGVDLYACFRRGEGWSKPVNLGPSINTEGDEMFPWVDDSGKLYFSSTGHPGLGGLDLFVIDLARSSQEVQRLPVPLNSMGDDFQITIDKDRRMGFFTSNREGGEGGDDILAFRILAKVKGVVVEKGTEKPLNGVEVSIVDARREVGKSMTEKDGEFEQGLPDGLFWMVVEKDGYEKHTQKIRIDGDRDAPRHVEIQLKPKDECVASSVTVKGKTLKKGALEPGTRVKIMVKDTFLVSNADGEFDLPLPKGFKYTLLVDEPGLAQPSIQELDIPAESEELEIPVQLEFDISDPATPFFIIYYDLDKSDIRKFDAQPELDRVVAFMKRKPEVRVRISSHTDSRASKLYNIGLSKRRAKETVDYLVENGIDPVRLERDWHGEEDLTNRCGDNVPCDEGEHQANRRTEFRVIR